jgi:hypothetical protein
VPPAMTIAPPEPELAVERVDAPAPDPHAFFRLRAIMRQGTAASLPAVWEQYATIDAARAAVRGMYSNDRVLRVLIVSGDVPPRFVEWVER